MNILGSTLSNVSCPISDIFCQISLISFEQLVNRPNSPLKPVQKTLCRRNLTKQATVVSNMAKLPSCIFNQAEMIHNIYMIIYPHLFNH